MVAAAAAEVPVVVITVMVEGSGKARVVAGVEVRVAVLDGVGAPLVTDQVFFLHILNCYAYAS